MIVHKDKMMFRDCNKSLNTEEGKDHFKEIMIVIKTKRGYKGKRND